MQNYTAPEVMLYHHTKFEVYLKLALSATVE